MRTVTGNNYYSNDIALYSYLYSYLILLMTVAFIPVRNDWLTILSSYAHAVAI